MLSGSACTIRAAPKKSLHQHNNAHMDKNTKTAVVVALVAFFMSRDLRTAGILGATAFAANYFL